MMVKPSVAELLEKVDNRFKLVSITSKRARQILDERHKKDAQGDSTDEFEESPVTLAAEEIAAGKVKEAKEENEEVEEVEEGKEDTEC